MLRADQDPFEEILCHIGKFWPPEAEKHNLEYRFEPLSEDDTDSGQSSDTDAGPEDPDAQVSMDGMDGNNNDDCACITELGECCHKCATCDCNNGAGQWCHICANNDDL